MKCSTEKNGQAKPCVVKAEGQQVFTADYVFEQMMAQGRRIDRARSIAFAAGVIAVAAVILSIVALCS